MKTLESIIATQTDCDASAIAEEVMCNFFDNKADIISILLKPNSDEEAGRMLRSMLKIEIRDSIKEAEFDAGEDSPELNLKLFNRNEAR